MLFKYKIFILYLMLFIYSSSVYSQNYYHKEFTVTDGLSQSQVLSLFQDKKGSLWIGTYGGGINIYNGIKFLSLTKDNGLAGNSIYSITQDNSNNIIIGTDNGLSVYNGFTFKNYSTKDGLPSKKIWSVAVDKYDKIWIGTDKGVAILYKNKILKFNKNVILASSKVYNICIDKDQNVWFGTNNNGLIMYSKNKFKIFTENDSLCYNTVRAIVQDKKGIIWIGTDRGLNHYINGKLIIYKKSTVTYYCSFLSHKGEICLLAYNGSFVKYKYNNNKIERENYKFNDRQFFSAIEDREGNTWIGTNTGLIKFPSNVFYNYSEDDGMQNNNIFSIYGASDGDFWFASSKEGVARLKDKNFYLYSKTNDDKGIIGSQVYSIIEDKNNNMWFGTFNGISVFNQKDSAFYNYTNQIPEKEKKNTKKKELNGKVEKKNNIKTILKIDTNITNINISSIIQDKSGIIWFGTYNGITRFYNNIFENFNTRFPVLKGKVILKIFEDKIISGRFCFATNEGIYFYDGKTLVHFGEKDGFVDDKVVSIEQDKRGNYWFGTKQGVYRFDSNNFEKIDKSKGLSSNNIYLLIMDNHENLFIGSNKGLDKLNTKIYNKSKKIIVRKYSNIEGFIGQECNLNACFKDKTGKIWFGTVDGVTVYNPKNDTINIVTPFTYISDIKLDFKNFDYLKYSDGIDSLSKMPINLSLPYNQNHLTFDFYSTSYTIPEKVKFQYMLEPLEKEWSPAFSKNEVDYPLLPPGKYTFKVRACNNDDIWNETPTIFTFTIRPPFWFTWWGITAEIILGFVIVYFYIKYREAALIKEKKILEQKVEERTIEIREQKEIVEQKNKDITDSINYAKNIQDAILPHLEDFEKIFPDSFILFKPRDIVSGDFYWLTNKNDCTYIAVADCTGHGVPGAFMSMLGIALLNEIINLNEKISVGSILDKLRYNVISSLHQTGQAGKSKDGMDITLCFVDWKEKQLHISGANNPLYLIRNDTISEIKVDKMPIGYGVRMDNFTSNIINIEYNDSIFLFSDGYADQFGGPNGKKFKYSQLKETLININKYPMSDQKNILNKTIEDWKKDTFQVDDILMLGIKFNHPQFLKS